MISVEEARELVLKLATDVQVEQIGLEAALGRVMAAPAISLMTQPPFDASAMDGYAIRKADMSAPRRVMAEAAAGRPLLMTAEPMTAVRIFTGAPVPAGYDRVVMQEHVTRSGDWITINDRSDATNIRAAAEDFRAGDTWYPRRRLTPSDIALLAAMNVPRITVARRPRVAILAGGNELVRPGDRPGPEQIISSNDLAIAAIVRGAGGDPFILPIARDTKESLKAGFAAASGSDLLITIGGASVGDHDLVGKVADELGMERAFHRIGMRPGKPLMAGRIADMPMIGLPGNPVSAITCGILFVEPLIHAMQGLDSRARPRKARLSVSMPPEGNRQHYLRATLEEGNDLPMIRPFEVQDSARLSLMAKADALLIRPAGDPARTAGDIVTFLPFMPDP